MERRTNDVGQVGDSELRLSELVDKFLDARANGELPSIDDYAAEAPDLAELLNDLLPALQFIDRSGVSPRQTGATEGPTSPRQLGDYRLIRELGRGGMGIVYEAEERSLGRRVALKVLPFASLLDQHQLTRFKNEVRAAALLKHPNIVTIYAVGCSDGVHFYAMELIEGLDLSQVMLSQRATPTAEIETSTVGVLRVASETTPLAMDRTDHVGNGFEGMSWASIASLGAQAAAALEHAHSQGVIHRDIKPSNLLLDREGRLFITDFGLARIQEDTHVTGTLDLLGTLRYMPPEQISGPRYVDHRSDIYSLGLTLYELAVGRPAFDAPSRERLMHDILTSDPPAPRRICPQMPSELETILLKATAKEAAVRYASAAQMQSDLERYIQGKPVLARRVSTWSRFSQWCRRRPSVAMLAGLLLSVLLTLAVVGPLMVWHQADLARQAQQNLSIADLNRAYQAYYSGNVHGAEELLVKHADDQVDNSSRFAPDYLRTKLQKSEENVIGRHTGPIETVATSSDGALLAWAGAGNEIHLVDPHSGQPRRVIATDAANINSLAFSPDGESLAVGGEANYFAFYDLDGGSLWLPETLPVDDVLHLRYSPDGQSVVVATRRGGLGLWRSDGTRAWETQAHDSLLGGVAVSPDGRSIVTCSMRDPMLKAWDLSTGQWQRDVVRLSYTPFGLTFSPADGALISHCPLGVQIWDPASGQERQRLQFSTYPISCAAANEQGYLATGGYDNLVIVWDLNTRARLGTLIGHRRWITSLAFSPDASTLYSASKDGVVRCWDLSRIRQNRKSWESPDLNRETSLAIASQTGTLVSVAATWEVPRFQQEAAQLTIWDSTTHAIRQSLQVDVGDGKSIAISPSDEIIATAGQGGVKRFDGRRGTLQQWIERQPAIGVSISPCGQWLAFLTRYSTETNQGESESELGIWDLHRDQLVLKHNTGGSEDLKGHLSFSHDSKSLAFALRTKDRTHVHLWHRTEQDWQSQQAILLPWMDDDTTSLSFVAKSDDLLITSGTGRVTRFASESGHELWSVEATSRAVHSAAVTSDGKLLATGGNLHIQLWHLERGQRLAELDVPMWVSSLCFTADGRTLIWGGGDGSVNFEDSFPRNP